jgi:hypothetical protein
LNVINYQEFVLKFRGRLVFGANDNAEPVFLAIIPIAPDKSFDFW